MGVLRALDPRQFACPRTGAPLELDPDGAWLRAESTGAVYPVRQRIPCFLAFDPAESTDERQQLALLNQTAHRDGWRSAIEAIYGPNSGMVDYVTNPIRLRVLDLLNLTAQDSVLEIGCGLGQMTVALARQASHVLALDVVSEQCSFTAMRCQQEGCDNVDVACGGDDCRLPCLAGQFDAVVANLVFEWCGSRSTSEPILDAQRRFLGEARRVLKPGGRLLLATKNRFALRYLLGKPDEHTFNMRFGNALPRPLMNWLLRRRGHSRPGGLLHSHGALYRLLSESGFVSAHSYWAVPEMRFPSEFVSTEAASVRAARRRPGFVQGEFRTTRALMPLVPSALVKFVTPGLLWIAKASDLPGTPRQAESTLENSGEESGLRAKG